MIHRHPFILAVLVGFALAVAGGCAGVDQDPPGNGDPNGNGNGDSTGNGDPEEPPFGTVTGYVLSLGLGADGFERVAGATLRHEGEALGVTDASGAFSVEVPSGTAILTIDHDDHARGVRRVEVAGGTDAYLEVPLLPIEARATFEAADGGRLRTDSGAEVVFPPGSLVRADGTAPEGEVEVTLAPLLVGGPLQYRAFPGDFAGRRTDDSDVLLETIMPVEITAREGEARLTISEDTPALLYFPVLDRAPSPGSVELWSLDEETGIWLEEGRAHMIQGDDWLDVYRAELTHLSWWNLDRPVSERGCVRGCLGSTTGAYRPHVTLTGLDHRFANTVHTDENGCFALDGMLGGRVAISATSSAGRYASDGVILNVGGSIAIDRGSCLDIGDLTLIPGGVTESGCLLGYTRCNGICVDVATSESHCGDCNVSCEVDPPGDDEWADPLRYACVAGTCGCEAPRDMCDSRCVDLRWEQNHCGVCDHACDEDERCEEGVCEPIDCGGDGLLVCDLACVDPETDRRHCGDCNDPCTAGQECAGGHCVDTGE